MDNNPLSPLLNIKRPKGKLMVQCKIAAESIREVVLDTNMHTLNSPLAYTYFVAILNTLEQLAANTASTQIVNESFCVLLSLVIQKVSNTFLVQQLPKLLPLLKAERNRFKNTSLVIAKYTLPMLTKIYISSQNDKYPFDSIKESLLDGRRTVRRVGTKCMCKLLSWFFTQPQNYSLATLLSRDLEEYSITAFNKLDSKMECKDPLFILYFLGVALQILPSQVGTNLMSHFFTLLEYGANAISIPTYLTIETFMAAKQLSADFVEYVLKYLLNNSPTGEELKDNDVVYISYMQGLVQTMQNLNRAKKMITEYMPAFVTCISEFLISPSVRVAKSAYNSLQAIFNNCLTPLSFKKKQEDIGIEGLIITEENIDYLSQTVVTLKYLLTERFEEIKSEVFKLIGLFAEKLKEGIVPQLPELLSELEIKKEYYS